MKLPILHFSVLLVLSLLCLQGHAEKADRDKPLVFLADQARSDDLKQTHELVGNVTLTKGSIVVRGERVEVSDDAQGYQHVTVVATNGKRAFFRQKREGADEYFEGEAETIAYDGQTNRVKLMQHAELRRLRGATLADELTGSVITYDNNTDVFTMDGQISQGGRGGSNGQIKGTLTPKATSNSAPKTGQDGSATLRPSTALSGERK